MRLCTYLSENTIIETLKAKRKEDALREIVSVLRERGVVDEEEPYYSALLDRERLCSTGIGKGVAIPHAKLSRIDSIIVSFARSLGGVDFDSVDKQPVYLIFTIFTPEDVPEDYLSILARISRIAKDDEFRERIMKASSVEEMMEIFREEDEKFEEEGIG